jgi:hypothetical protein
LSPSASVNECELLTPCLNGATCEDGEWDYVCHCPAGYFGKTCDTSIFAQTVTTELPDGTTLPTAVISAVNEMYASVQCGATPVNADELSTLDNTGAVVLPLEFVLDLDASLSYGYTPGTRVAARVPLRGRPRRRRALFH